MITNETLKSIIQHFADEGKAVRARDVAFTLLSRMFTDPETAYRCLFGTEGFGEYSADPIRDDMETYLGEQGYIRTLLSEGGITFEDNKNALEQMISDIEFDMAKGLIEKKDGYARIADIRVKLNDKFNVQQEKQNRLIVVEKKYNGVCQHCHHEIYVPTKEDLMEQYDLVERNKTE